LEDIEDQMAEKLAAICPVNVFDIEGKGWENAMSLRSKKDNFICK